MPYNSLLHEFPSGCSSFPKFDFYHPRYLISILCFNMGVWQGVAMDSLK
jgi:hypothetical protein